MIEPEKALAVLWRETGGNANALAAVKLTGTEPVMPSSFAVGTLAQTSIAATGLAAAELWRMRTGRMQHVAVNMFHAAEEFRSERWLRVDGRVAGSYRHPLAGIYRCAHGGWARPHLTFPHHRDGILRLLGCDPANTDKDTLRHAFLREDAKALEIEAAAAGLPLSALRTFAEWDVSAQAGAVAAIPLVAIEHIGDAPAKRLPLWGSRPLDGIRVLELTQIIAGPVCGRSLAAHGADVLLVSSAHRPSVHQLVIDTGRGKLSCYLDLHVAKDREHLRSLLSKADVFLQSYRPGALEALGFGANDAANLRPGIIYAELSAWGWTGPWAGRRGYDSLVQTATGFNHAEAEMAGDTVPNELPSQALDHASGYLLALGIMQALARRAEKGGSWRVRVCLARTGLWLRSLGRLSDGLTVLDPDEALLATLLYECMSGFGQLLAVRHAALLSETPAHWARPSVPLGTDPPAWP